MTLAIQIVVLVLLAALMAAWAVSFPYPSPWLRVFLSPRIKWPESQIREWLQTGTVHPRFLSYFSRDPERTPPAAPGLVAPADGTVIGTEQRGGIRYLVIALSFWDMHVQRSPVAGRITAIEASGDQIMDGEGLEFAFLREKQCPVQTRVVLETEEYGPIAVRLITSLAARRIEVWAKVGDRLERGQRLGRILLGSTVVLEMPEVFPLRVQRRQRVRAGETVVATGAAA